MLSKLWDLVPVQYRWTIDIGLLLIVLSGTGYVFHVMNNYDNVVKQNKVMSDELVKTNVLIAQIQKDNAILKAGRENAIQHIKKTSSKDRTPPALLDTIEQLHVDTE